VTSATLTRPATAVGPAGGEARTPLMRPYLGYVGYFVGAGLISGGIVHYPLDPARYALVAVAGVVLFVAATVLNEVVLPRTRPHLAGVARLVTASLLLSLGIGMLSGGIQHFLDFPARGALLVPAGLLLSFAAYAVRQASHPGRALRLGGGVAVLAGLTFLGLQQAAAAVESTGGEHAHDAAVTAEPSSSVPEAVETVDAHTDGHAH
jgi:glucose dehydrogenase